MGNIGISGRQGRPERPAGADTGQAGPPTAPTPDDARRAAARASAAAAAAATAAASAPAASAAAAAPAALAAPAGRRCSHSGGRGRDRSHPRVVPPTPPPPPPPVPPPRARHRSRSRSPLGRQRLNNQDRLMDALFLEAMACSSCQRAGGGQGVQGAQAEPQVPPCPAVASAASAVAVSAGLLLRGNVADDRLSQSGSAEPHMPSPAILSPLSTASAFDCLTPSSRAGLESVPLPEPHGATEPESFVEMEGAADKVASPQQLLQEKDVVSDAIPDGMSCEMTSSEHVPIKDVSFKDVQIKSEVDASSVGTDTTTSTLTSAEGGDARQAYTRDSEEDVDAGSMIESTTLDGFYFGAMMSVDDKLKTDYFEEVRLRTQQYFDATRSGDEDVVRAVDEKLEEEGKVGWAELPVENLSVTGEEENKAHEVDVDVEAAAGCPAVEGVAEDNGVYSDQGLGDEERDSAPAEATETPEPQQCVSGASPNNTEASSTIIVDDASSRRTIVADDSTDHGESAGAPHEVDADSLCSRLAALREQSDTPSTPVSEGDAAPELMEIARTSMALTAASSSVPDSESVARFEEDEAADDVVDTAEGAGDDTLVGCDMDLKHVAGGLFDTPGAPTPAPVQHNTLVKGSSLPAAATVEEEQPAAPARPDRRLSALGGFKRRRSATASALPTVPTAPTITTPPQSAQSEERPAESSLGAPGAPHRPRTDPQPDPQLTFGLTKPGRVGAPSSHRILSDVLQNIKQAILPRRADGRRSIAKMARSGHRLKKKTRSEEQSGPEEAEGAAPPGAASSKELAPDTSDEPLPPEAEDGGTGASDEATGVLTDGVSLGSQSRRASRKPSEEKNCSAGVKKNHVDPSPTMEIHIKPKNPAAYKTAPNQSNQEIDAHPRSSRASIAPPRTNFLSENVLRSLARSSSIKYIDSTQRSNLRAPRNKTPERYRNVPPLLRRSGSGASGSTTSSKTSSPRFVASKRGSNKIRKRIKTSETIICREISNATINIERLADHKVDNKYYVYTVNDNNATELRLSEMFVLHEETVTNEDFPTTAVTAASKTMPVKAKKTCKPAVRRSSTSRSRDSTARGQLSTVVAKTLAQGRFPPKQKRGKAGEMEKNSKSDQLSVGAGEKKTSSSTSLRKRRIEILKLFADSCTRVTDETEPAVSGQSSSGMSYKVDLLLSDKEGSPHSSQDAATPRAIGGISQTKSHGRKAPRYRPTLRTPRISHVGMNAGNESASVYRKEFEIDNRAVTRARVPNKHMAKLSHTTTFPFSQQTSTKSSKTLELTSTPPSARNGAALAPFSGLREVTEMLMEYSTLTSASGRSFADVSELVSLFEASTKVSLPSVGNESHGAVVASPRPSIDEVLEEIRKVHEGDRPVSRGEGIKISENTGDCKDSELKTVDTAHPDGPISQLSDKQTTKSTGTTDTEAKVAAALQEILNSLTDLRCAEAEDAENKPESSVLDEARHGLSARERPSTEEEKSRNDHENIEVTNQALQQSNVSRHMHGLRYKPSKGRSTFDVLETVLADGCSTITKEGLNEELAVKVVDRLGSALKVNTWTLPPVPTRSDSVQATVSTANADCQRTAISSPKDKSHEAVSNSVTVGEDALQKYDEKLFYKRVTDMRESGSQIIPPANLTFENSQALESFDFLDYSPDLIPRSHHSILQMSTCQSEDIPIFKSSNTILRRNSSHGNVQTTLQHIGGSTQDLTRKVSQKQLSPATKLTGFQRAQRRIAGFLDDDVPATVLSVLTEVLPLFLTRTRAELSSSRQTTLQHILLEDYFDHPANASEECNPREDPQARLLVGTMVYQISLLVEDAARSAEMVLQSDTLRPP